MSLIRLSAPGVFDLLAPGKLALLSSASGASGGGSTFAGPYVNSIQPASLFGWWDAGELTNPATAGAAMLDSGGSSVTGWNSSVATVVDASGNGRAMTVIGSTAYNGTGAKALARRCGALGGLCCYWTAISAGNVMPFVAPPAYYTVGSAPLQASSAWSLYFVWSRPNLAQKQATTFAGRFHVGPMTLLQHGSVNIVQIDNTGSDALTVFGTSLPANLTARHTHSLTLINTPGTGVDVYLDDAKLNSAPIACTLSAAASLIVNGNGGDKDGGAAQCMFHEMALWSRALDSTDLATLLTSASSASKRWTRGPRQGLAILGMGQSNWDHFKGAGGIILLSDLISYYTGAIAVPVYIADIDGTGVFDTSPSAFFTANWSTDPSTWPLGTYATTVQNLANSIPAADLADVCGIYWHWSENDSSVISASRYAYGKAAWERALGLTRSYFGKSAAQMPIFYIRALSYGSANLGSQIMRIMSEEIAADATQNAYVVLRQTSDAVPLGSTYNADGTWVDGTDTGTHVDDSSNQMFARRDGEAISGQLVKLSLASDPTAPGSVPAGANTLGPQIASAHYEGTTYAATGTVLITIQHDQGTDLKTPLQAVNGYGWAVMDGGTVLTTPGTIVSATACARVDATHVRITLSQTLANAGSALLFYPYGSNLIGRGDAVTDNYSDITKPAGWDAGSAFGPAWNIDWPLQAPTSGIPLT